MFTSSWHVPAARVPAARRAFLVPGDAQGLFGKKEEKWGRGQPDCGIGVEDVRVPVENRLAEEGWGPNRDERLDSGRIDDWGDFYGAGTSW